MNADTLNTVANWLDACGLDKAHINSIQSDGVRGRGVRLLLWRDKLSEDEYRALGTVCDRGLAQMHTDDRNVSGYTSVRQGDGTLRVEVVVFDALKTSAAAFKDPSGVAILRDILLDGLPR